ncbi:MAG TPA: ERCC4 domain-containing protein [Gaiellaceae bacterium]|nr:ERCC4 domain-containing protein [Gaiellaceae bacterium]
MVEIRVDAREPAVMCELLEEAGALVRVERLPAGDYAVGADCLVERKHVVDFHHSLVRGRLWPQIGRLRASASEPCLLVEGGDLKGPVHPDAVRGALLAATEIGVTVIRSDDRADSAAWLYRLAHRRQVRGRRRIRPRYAQRPRSPADEIPEAMLGAVPGISRVTAVALLDRFGSIAAIASASPAEWRIVPGLGEKRCAALSAALGLDAGTSDSDVSRNGLRLAT